MFAKHTRNLDQVYHSEFSPLKFQIAEKLRHSPLLKSLSQESRSVPLFEDSAKAPLIQRLSAGASDGDFENDAEIEELELGPDSGLVPNQSDLEWDHFRAYHADSARYKAVDTDTSHQFDIDNLYFDPNQFSIINKITNSSQDKRILLEEFPELKSLINNDLGFALEKKRCGTTELTEDPNAGKHRRTQTESTCESSTGRVSRAGPSWASSRGSTVSSFITKKTRARFGVPTSDFL